jgi:hypothetical protein
MKISQGFAINLTLGAHGAAGDELASVTGGGARGVTAKGCDGRWPVGD